MAMLRFLYTNTLKKHLFLFVLVYFKACKPLYFAILQQLHCLFRHYYILLAYPAFMTFKLELQIHLIHPHRIDFEPKFANG